MKGFKRYERYKDSGVEWIGEIPEHWDLTKLKYVTKCLDGRRIPLSAEERGEKQGDIPYWGANGIIDYVNDYLIDEEVVLLGEDGAPFFDKSKDVAFYSNGKIWPNNHIHILQPTKIYIKLLVYLLNAVDYTDYINGSTRDKLTQSDMGNINLLSIPFDEQQAIVNFLDQKTSEIDSLIADKERLIELLQEQRQAIITQAVTKGLDPNVPMKDSGVEWIGEIPEHWLTVAVKRVYDIKLGKMLQPTQNKSDDVLVPYLKALHVQWEKIEVNEYPEMWASPKDIEMFSVKPGDLLICEGGEVGRAAILEDLDRPCIIQNSLHRIRPSVKAKNKYLLYILQIISQKGWLDVLCNKATIAHFTSDKLGNLRIPLPPIEEQEKVIKVIENKAKLLNNYISCEREIIEKLKNYRQSLITAAVTGKIDVRDYYNLRSE